MTQMEAMTLYELNALVRQAIGSALPGSYWVQAELSEAREAAGGHCYLELVQKDRSGRKLVAKARANIWQSVYILLKPMFERETGRKLVPGIKVLLQVQVSFHELYGYALTVLDIDPWYTVGDLARQRQEILRRLESEGILNDNKRLVLPMSVNRVAVISSASAAGYGDFCKQLKENEYGFGFVVRLFPSVMQGEKAEESILSAMDAILREKGGWDVVVIIRGGGAASDLSCFDTYMLAAACAQFPIPIVTGIGHERDDTVLDLVAHTRVKTPTAAAAFLIGRQLAAARGLADLRSRLERAVPALLKTHEAQLSAMRGRLPAACMRRCERGLYALERVRVCLKVALGRTVVLRRQRLETFDARLRASLPVFFQRERSKLQLAGKIIEGADPQNVLRRGYSLTLCGGHIVRRAADVSAGDVITTRLADGQVQSRVE